MDLEMEPFGWSLRNGLGGVGGGGPMPGEREKSPQLRKVCYEMHGNAERLVWTCFPHVGPSLKGSLGAGLMAWALP